MNPFWCRPERVQDNKQFFSCRFDIFLFLAHGMENGARAACMVLHA